jgi:hypothetical protein
MSTRIHISDELKAENSQFPADANGMPYGVPQAYFEGLAAAILDRIKAESLSASDELASLSPLLSGLSKKPPYSVPDQYFEANIASLPVLAREEEEDLAPAFGRLTLPFEAPLGYFESFPSQMLAKVARPAAKVIPISRRTWMRPVMRLAVAAMVAGIITVSGIFYYRRSDSGLAVTNPQWVSSQLKNVSDKDLEEFVKTTAPVTASLNTKPAKSPEVKKLLQDVSDNELDAFLSQVPAEDEGIAIN